MTMNRCFAFERALLIRLFLWLLLLIRPHRTAAFVSRRPVCLCTVAALSLKQQQQQQQRFDEDTYPIAQTEKENPDLQPPYFNLRKESLLFDDHSTTSRHNNVRKFWEFCETNLPYVIHGSRKTATHTRDALVEPLDAIYNMVLVRLPAIVTAVLYVRNQLTGHPLIVDIGEGPFELPLFVVLGIFYVLLR